MKELVDYYRAKLKWLVGLIITGLVFIPNFLIPLLNNNLAPAYAAWAVKGANALTSKFAVVGFFVVGEVIIRTWLWKFKHRELDLEGDWRGENIYTEVRPGGPLQPVKKVEHTLKFEQNCLKFVMKPSTGESFVNWGYHAINFVAAEETVKYAYWVNYNDSSFPPSAIGYEELKVTEYEKGRPVKLSGWFRHCVNGTQPAYSGTVTFWRQPKPNFLSRVRSWFRPRRRKK